VSFWEDTIKKTKDHAIPYINYGIALMNVGRMGESLEILKKSMSDGVKNTGTGRTIAANNLGIVYLNKEDLDQAKRWFIKAFLYEPSYYKTYYHMGLIYYIKGTLENSSEYYKKRGFY